MRLIQTNARDVLVMWRMEHVKARFTWLEGAWGENAERFEAMLGSVISQSTRLDQTAPVGNMVRSLSYIMELFNPLQHQHMKYSGKRVCPFLVDSDVPCTGENGAGSLVSFNQGGGLSSSLCCGHFLGYSYCWVRIELHESGGKTEKGENLATYLRSMFCGIFLFLRKSRRTLPPRTGIQKIHKPRLNRLQNQIHKRDSKGAFFKASTG